MSENFIRRWGGGGGNGTDISLLHLVLGRPVGKKSMFFVGETTKYKFFFFKVGQTLTSKGLIEKERVRLRCICHSPCLHSLCAFLLLPLLFKKKKRKFTIGLYCINRNVLNYMELPLITHLLTCADYCPRSSIIDHLLILLFGTRRGLWKKNKLVQLESQAQIAIKISNEFQK